MAQLLDRVAAEPWLRDEIVQKVPRGGPGDIKLGSPLIVQPGESAVFIRQGEPLATFGPGTHVLSVAVGFELWSSVTNLQSLDFYVDAR